MISLPPPLSRIAQWRWPLPAMLAWAASWLMFVVLQKLGVGAMTALLLACGLGVAMSLLGQSWWRRVIIGAGFPLSLALSGVATVPAWAWLLPLLLLLLIYPLNAWRDAPLFPTPADALHELPRHAALPLGALVLDAGSGLGHGLSALRQVYPQARLHGLEWSWPLRAVSAMICPWARVRHGDIWLEDWQPYSMVYMFQRPESMPRAVAKAGGELAAGAWLVSLEFEAADLVPQAKLQTPDGRPIWLYQSPFVYQKAADAVI